MLVLVTGGTGFVGSNIVDGLLERGHRVRCLVRRRPSPEQPHLCHEMVPGDVKDLKSLSEATEGVDAVIHLVGIIRETPEQSFQSAHVDGTRNVVLAMKEHRIPRLLHMSALGTREGASSRYHQSKWEAENIVRASGLDFTIFRPSVIVGHGDGFTSTLVDLTRRGPVVPVIGSGDYRLQPVAVEDVVKCFVESLEGAEHTGRTYELCGPEALSFNRMLDEVMSALGISKPKVHIPPAAVSPAARLMEKVLKNPPITSDQLVMLREDNVCSSNAAVEVFGLAPKPFDRKIREFL